MTKLISHIDAFERLAKTAKLRAEGIGPADRKPHPRPPMPPSTVMPERKNIFEGKPKAEPLPPAKLEEQNEKLNKRIKEPAEPKAKKEIIPAGPVSKMSPKELDVLEKQRQDYFKRQQEKPELDAKQLAKSEKMKQRYLDFIKKNDPGSFIAYMKNEDPEFNAKEYLAGLKALKEETKPGTKEEKFTPNYSATTTETPEGSADPSTFTHGEFEMETFVQNLNDNDEDVYSHKNLDQIMKVNNLTKEEAIKQLSNQGKYLLRVDRWVVTPTPVIERAADTLDVDPKLLERFVAEIPDQANMPLSVNQLVEMYLEQSGFKEEESFEEG